MDLQPPPHDIFQGAVTHVGDPPIAVLVIGAPGTGMPGQRLYIGRMVVLYGLAFLYEPDFLLPQWAYDDFRREYHADAALDFMMRKGEAFPRADVVGQRVSTGTRTDLFLKQLDLGRGVLAFAYASLDAPKPLARLSAALWVEPTAPGWRDLPDGDERASVWLRQAVPCFVAPPCDLHALPARLPALHV
mgnify:CR=1 FL=1